MAEAEEKKQTAVAMPEDRRDIQSQLPLMLAVTPESCAAGGQASLLFLFQ